MIQAGIGLLIVPPQAAERIDFELEPGVVLIAALVFVLVNLLLAAALYPYLSSSSEKQAAQEMSEREDVIEEASSDDGELLDERVDEFLEDIHGEEQGG